MRNKAPVVSVIVGTGRRRRTAANARANVSPTTRSATMTRRKALTHAAQLLLARVPRLSPDARARVYCTANGGDAGAGNPRSNAPLDRHRACVANGIRLRSPAAYSRTLVGGRSARPGAAPARGPRSGRLASSMPQREAHQAVGDAERAARRRLDVPERHQRPASRSATRRRPGSARCTGSCRRR